MKAFYRDFEEMRHEKFDGMIITGAPVEHLDFEDVTYWDEMINAGIINIDDIDDVANLSSEKQEAIKKFVSSKLQDVIERKSNERGKQEEKL